MSADDRSLPAHDRTDPDDVHTAAAEHVTDEQVRETMRAQAERVGKAESDVARATAELVVKIDAYAIAVHDPVERAKVAQLALSHVEALRDRLLRAAVEAAEYNAAEVARRVGVRPQVVVMAMARREPT